MRTIDLGKGYVAIVGDEDYERVSQLKWYVEVAREGRYTRPIRRRTLDCKYILMHRFILDAPDGVVVDHINGDAFDNRRSNLRLCTGAQNARNCRRRRDSGSPYKCVRQIPSGSWIAYVRKDGERLYLGAYPTAEEAARAYDKAAREIYGEFAKLNFGG